MFITIILIFILSCTVTLGLTSAVISFARKYGLVDNPSIRPHPAHTHTNIIPRAGGLSIFIGIFFPMLLLFPFPKYLIGIFIGAVILILVGLWDDKRDRSPYIRFITNCIAAGLAIGFGVGIPYLTNPFGGIIHLDSLRINFDILGPHSILVFADLFALLWIVWTTNIVGWSGGVDGQLPGIVSIASIIIGLLSLRFATADPNQLHITYLSFATAGAFLGFIPWNFYPQKIMPGYGGKTLAGYMLAVLSILSFSKLGAALLVLAVPMIDALFILLKRLFTRKSPVKASTGHLHHHLLSLGWGRRRIAVFYWIVSGAAGLVALSTHSKQKLFAALFILVLITMFIIWINFWKRLPGETTLRGS